MEDSNYLLFASNVLGDLLIGLTFVVPALGTFHHFDLIFLP